MASKDGRSANHGACRALIPAALTPVARGPARVRDAAAAAREIMIYLPMDSSGVAALSDRRRSVTRTPASTYDGPTTPLP